MVSPEFPKWEISDDRGIIFMEFFKSIFINFIRIKEAYKMFRLFLKEYFLIFNFFLDKLIEGNVNASNILHSLIFWEKT